MPNGNENPDHRDLWVVVNEARLDVAELKGMLKMHISDPNIHHHPPCKNGKIDIVVIYKLDRLSRSLLDFMKLAELFEAHNTSIVSVTQQINTSTSAGRMMLNILMTFAQYERELIAERIRDKIAGAKRRGKHCGGTPVLGYDTDSKTKKLVVNKKEAPIVRHVFERYCKIGSAREVAKELNNQGHRNKSWTTRKDTFHKGGKFKADIIYRMLKNPLYIGQVIHKDKIYEGEQDAIIERSFWDTANSLLVANTRAKKKSKFSISYPLKGLVRCGYCGGSMTTTYTQKRNRRYIYLQCVKDMKRAEPSCPLRQVSGDDFEKAVLQQLSAVFRTPSILAKTYDAVRKNVVKEKASLLERQDDLSDKLELLRQKMFQAGDTASHGELNAIREETVKLDTELKQVKNYIQIFSSGSMSRAEITEAFNNIEVFWEELFPVEKYRLARLFIEKIVLFNSRMEMEIKTNGVRSLVKELNTINGERS